jgi:hypothetical protein
LDVPPDVGLKRRPPEAVQKRAASGVKAVVSEVIMSIVDECEALLGQDVELVAAVLL